MEAVLPKKESKKDRRKGSESGQGHEENPSNSREKKSRKKGDGKKKKSKKRTFISKEDEASKLGHHINVAIEDSDSGSVILTSGKLRAESPLDGQGKATNERTGYSTDETERQTNLFSEERNDDAKAANVNKDMGHVEIEGIVDQEGHALQESVKSTEGTHDLIPTLRRRATLTEMGGSLEEEEIVSQEITSTEVRFKLYITQY